MRYFKTTLVSIAVFIALFAASSVPANAQSEEPKVVNIGFVLYTKSRTPGTLTARWNYANRYFGPGLVTGGPDEGFAGNYHVRYFYENGKFSDEYDMKVKQNGNFFDVTWLVNGVVKARGVGMLVEEGTALAVGWRRVDD